MSVLRKKALVFLRHHNDIDHIVPVLYKWGSTKDVVIRVVITTSAHYLTDYRIDFLSKLENVIILHVDDFKHDKIDIPIKGLVFRGLDLLRHWSVSIESLIGKSAPTHKYSRRKHLAAYRQLYNRGDLIGRIFDWAFGAADKYSIVVFDWAQPIGFIGEAIIEAKRRGITTVALPHGDSPYYNLLETNDSLCANEFMVAKKDPVPYDYVVTPNWLCARRYEQLIKADRLKILGSPRYNREWLETLRTLYSPFKPSKKAAGLKVVFFLRPPNYPVNWEEVTRGVKCLLKLPNIHLVVQYHPRLVAGGRKGADLLTEIKLYQNTGNLEFVYEEASPDALIDWADLILDLGTSATFYAVVLGKPVLAMEHMQANMLTLTYYMKSCDIRYRDDLIAQVRSFIQNPTSAFYDEQDRANFLKEVLGDPESPVLKRYVDFLNELVSL